MWEEQRLGILYSEIGPGKIKVNTINLCVTLGKKARKKILITYIRETFATIKGFGK